MQFWIIQGLNSLSLGGLLFLLSSGFLADLRLDAARQPDRTARFSCSAPIFAAIAMRSYDGLNIWVTALGAGIAVAAIGGLFERLVLAPAQNQPAWAVSS